MLPTPGFHHLHLNAVDPAVAIDCQVRQFPTSAKGTWARFPALLVPNNRMIRFIKVDTPPVSEPQGAIWHFGWHVPDARATMIKGHQPRGAGTGGGRVTVNPCRLSCRASNTAVRPA